MRYRRNLKCTIKQHTTLTHGVMVRRAVIYRSQLIFIEKNSNASNIRNVLQPDELPYLRRLNQPTRFPINDYKILMCGI